ncbi:GTPase ObgE [Candidatus Peregrinibacteria bacterium]|nr:GTPase ObgE [Candidatus Peregrinibacteria bacterium]
MFCDELKIKLIAGKGGDGAVSFRREKFVPRGGPDGGDGGIGGDIIIKVNPQLNTLSHLTHTKTYRAEHGTNGRFQKMHGKNAKHLILEVPIGTIVFTADKYQQLADLNNSNDEFIAAKGGRGGRGNASFVSSTYRAPRFAENGEPGEEKEILLELKLVADIGIIGLPSSGKSTLISVISNARPKIAAYHFTTLIPNLGVVDMTKFGGSPSDSFIVADIPGLIEGAHQGKGLGIQFLKHISRTKLLVHLIDGTLDNTKKNYQIINKELKAFDKNLAKRPQIVVLNKIDMLTEEQIKEKIKELGRIKSFQISALAKTNLKQLLFEISKQLIKLKEKTPPAPAKKPIPVLQPHLDQEKFKIEQIIQKKDHKIFVITGQRIEQIATMTNIINPEGLERMYHYIERFGIQRTVERQHAQFGDIIRIKDKNIPYRQ